MVLTLLAFIIALGVLIVIHELGHYSVARACGVKVLRFSVGFGPVLWRRLDRHETEWAVSAIPLGGYVKMLDEREGNVDPELLAQTFNRKTVWQRIAIVAAGPVANLLLAALLYAGLSFYGSVQPQPVLAGPSVGTVAALAGVQERDQILRVDGRTVESWTDARWHLMKTMTNRGLSELEVRDAQGAVQRRLIDFSAADIRDMEQDLLSREGFQLALPTPVIGEVMAGSAAEQAGLRPNDVILQVGELAAPNAKTFVDAVQAHPGQPVSLRVERDGAELLLSVTPALALDEASGRQVGRIGARISGNFPTVRVQTGLIASLGHGVVRTAEVAGFSLKMLGKMVVGEVSVKNLSGPVTIADYAGQTARIGLEAYIGFMALISVSLGVLNLLPIPMLDGGHLLYYLVEIIRGSPPPEKWMELGQRAGFGILMLMMAVALFNDMTRLFT
ncbi:MAG: RIP metalloprotease RseP [Pigmentiphaga sp.]|nr:RIP metalloprotease RseP [Pigmentiphaga sp.]